MTSNVQLIASFLAYLRAERGASENTLASYEHDVRSYAGHLGKPFRSAVRTDLQRYISATIAAGISGRSAARRLSCLRHFYRFLIDEEETTIDPTRNFPSPKSWKTVPKALGLGDLDKMVAHLGTSRAVDVRDRALLLTFFGSGFRASEIAGLKMRDLDLDAGAAKVWNGKGGRDGIVPLSPPSIAALKVYFETARPKLGDAGASPYVFLSQLGGSLTRQAVWWRVRNAAADALGKRVSPHFLRHGFATALVEGGADIRDVQVLMRHSSVDTTAIYIHTDLNYLRRIYYASHPRARIAQAQG